MDSNRRHQLAQNDLANWFITQYEEWLQPNAKWIGVVGVVILALLAVFLGSARVMQWNKATAWNQYFQAFQAENPEDSLEMLADSSKGPIGEQARLSLAQMLSADATNLGPADKTKAVGQLEKAVDQFGRVRAATSDNRVIRQASFGLGQAFETLAAMRTGKNDLAEAEKEYKTLAERWPDDFYGKLAKKQLALLLRPDTKKFLEQSAAKVVEVPKTDDFKVDIDPNDPFKGMDATKALDKSSILGGAFAEPTTTETKPAAATDTPPSAAKSLEEKAEPVEEMKPEAKSAEEAKPEEEK